MSWPSRIERWRTFANWESRDIPTDLVLSIIDHESGGVPGEKSQATTKPGVILTDSGSEITYNRALGLMQVIPPNIESWNKHKTPKVTFEDMSGDDEKAVRLQIRLGSSIFANSLFALHRFDPVEFPARSPGEASSRQLQLALVAYAIGPGNPGGQKGLIPKLERLKELKRPLTLEALKATFPRWGYSEKKQAWINRPLKAAEKVWADFKKFAVETPVSKPGKLPSRPKEVFNLAWTIPIIISIIVAYIKRQELRKLLG